MNRLSKEQMYKLEESIAFEIDKALSLQADTPKEFVKDLSIVREFIAKQILALKADKYYSFLQGSKLTNTIKQPTKTIKL